MNQGFCGETIFKNTIYLFQKSGLMQLCLNICFSILAMKIFAKATATFVPMVVPWVCRYMLPQNWNEVSVNIRWRISLRYLMGIGALYT